MECKYENDVKRVLKILDGNGKSGLIVESATLKTKLDDMTDDIKKIATAMSAIANSQVEQDAIKKHTEENKERRASALKQVGTVFGIAFGSLGALYLILDHIG